MKPETQEWIDKAEGDRKVARREIQTADPVWNVVCFLAQQCAEKYLWQILELRLQFNPFQSILRRYNNAFKRYTDSSI